MSNKIFPQIDTDKMNVQIELFNPTDQETTTPLPEKPHLISVGLDSIILEDKQKFNFADQTKIKVILGKKNFWVSGQMISDKITIDRNNYQMEIALHFDEFDQFNNWLKFITALDLFNQKNQLP